MYKFSEASKERLQTCHPDLQRLFYQVINFMDCTIIEGHRDKEAQNKAFEKGKSKLKWPDGKHNKSPSVAADVSPYPIRWEDREQFTYFAGFVMGIARSLNIKIRWGGDWDMDNKLHNNQFDDLVHFELIQ